MRELEPFGDVLRSLIPIPEAWWQNQMFAVTILICHIFLSKILIEDIFAISIVGPLMAEPDVAMTKMAILVKPGH